MKPLIIGWLAARGITLANDATDQTVITTLQGAFEKSALAATALGNEKSTLASQITALQNDKTTLATRATTAETALANEQTARKADHKRAATLATDLVIQQGRLTVAQRDATITALANAADFDGEVKKLIEAATVVKTGADAVSGKQQSALGNEALALQNEYNQAFAAELIATGQNPSKAHTNIMTLPKYSGLAAKLVPAKKFDARKQTL